MLFARSLRLSLLALAALPAFAQSQLPRGITRVTSVEGITEYRLDNGLRAVLFPDASKPSMVVNITYLVGSRHEDYGETGMAHLIEHLVSYGSPRHPDAKREQNDRGASRNASTSFDRTNYFEVFPASDENLDWAFDLEADRMMNAPVTKEILASQMSVVRNEYEAGENSPQSVLGKRMLHAAFEWHNYGKTTIGAKSDIENVPIERLQQFYSRYYRPDNAVLIVAGRFEEAKALALLAKWFVPLKSPDTPVPQTYTADPTQDGERLVTLRRVGDTQQVNMLYKAPAAAHPDVALLSVAANVLNRAPSGRMYKALVTTKKAAAVFGGVNLTREPGFIMFGATVRKDASLDEARSIMTSMLDGLSAQPFTKEEVDRTRSEMLKDIELSLNASDQVGLTLTAWTAAGDWRLLFLHRDRIRNATPEAVQRAALAYLKPSNRTIGLFIPEEKPDRTEIPATPDLESLLKDYKGDAAVSEGEAFDPSPTNVESRTTRTVLPSGMKLVLLPKKNRGATVTAVLRLDLGDPTSLKGRAAFAGATASMLMRGTAKRTRQQIDDELTRLKAQMSVSGGSNSAFVNIQTVAANLSGALRLAAEVLREPAFPNDEFETMRNASLASLESSRTQPDTLAQMTLMRHLNQYPEDDVRYVRSVEEQLAAVRKTTLDDLRKFYRDFYGASNATLTVVGDFDADALRKIVPELFGDWKSPAPYTRVGRQFQAISAANESIKTPDKANALFTAGLLLNVGEASADYPAILIANYMLGGHSTSRLYARIRAKEGLSYGVNSSLQADTREARADWMMMAITNPVNIGKVEAAFNDEIAKSLKEGFLAAELAAAQKGWLQARGLQRAQDPTLAGRLLNLERDGRTMVFDGTLEQKVAALTAEQVNTAWRKHFDAAKISYVRAGDFK